MNSLGAHALLMALVVFGNGSLFGAEDYSKIKIISATYGSGKKQADVKDKVTDLLVVHPTEVVVSPKCLGVDPTPGWNKQLRITFNYHDQECSLQWDENKSFTSHALCQEADNKVTQSAPPSPTEPGVLDTLSQEGLNAGEWVLAPLDQQLPQEIRRNLAAMREDILDDGKNNPRLGTAVYGKGYQLCSALIAALDEREKMQVRAGYRVVDATSVTPVTSPELDARRSYKMRWPQYARERDQRNDARRVAAANDQKHTQITIERIKMEWSEHSTKLRKSLDALYSQYREALRESRVVIAK